MIQFIFKSTIISLFLLILSACGGGSDSDPESSIDIQGVRTGVFQDSPIANIGYRTQTRSGTTNILGEYHYLEGESVTFFIGNMEFPSVLAKPLITPLDLADTDDTSDSMVVNVVRLLQTLDENDDPGDGIRIPETANAIAEPLDFSVSISDFENDARVTSLLANLGKVTEFSGLVNSEEAMSHFESSLNNTYEMSAYDNIWADDNRYQINATFFTKGNQCRMSADEGYSTTNCYIENDEISIAYDSAVGTYSPSSITVINFPNFDTLEPVSAEFHYESAVQSEIIPEGNYDVSGMAFSGKFNEGIEWTEATSVFTVNSDGSCSLGFFPINIPYKTCTLKGNAINFVMESGSTAAGAGTVTENAVTLYIVDENPDPSSNKNFTLYIHGTRSENIDVELDEEVNTDVELDSDTTSLIIAPSSVPAVKVNSSAFAEVSVSDGIAEIPENKSNETQVISALAEDDSIIYISAFKPGNKSVELNALTTIKFILSQVPGIDNIIDLNDQEAFNSLIKLNEFSSLRNYISSNSDWSKDGNETYKILLSKAFEALNNFGRVEGSTGAQYSQIKQLTNTYQADYFIVKDKVDVVLSTSSNRQFAEDGLTISPVSMDDKQFTIKISNALKRTIVAIYSSEDPEKITDVYFDPLSVNVFTVSSGGLFSPESVEITMPNDYLAEKNDSFGLYTYGPGLGSKLPSTGLAASAFYYAITKTVFDNFVAPTLAVSGIPKSVLIKSFDAAVLKAFSEKAEIKLLISNQDYLKLAYELYRFYEEVKWNAIKLYVMEISEDYAKGKFLDALNKVVGTTINTFFSGIAVTATAAQNAINLPFIASADMALHWRFLNRLDTNLSFYAPTSSTDINLGYMQQEDLKEISKDSNYWLNDYEGDCIPTAESDNVSYISGVTICKAYYIDAQFGSTTEIEFTIYCNKPESTKSHIQSIPCREARIKSSLLDESDTVFKPTSEGSAVIKFSYEFEGFKEHKVSLVVVDTEGAEKEYKLSIQLFGLFPHVVPYFKDEPLQYSYFEPESKIATVEDIEIQCCDAGTNSISKNIKLVNEYKGIARIYDFEWITSSPNVDIEFDVRTLLSYSGNAGSSAATYNLTYTQPSDNAEDEMVVLRFKSRDPYPLGRDSAPISWDGQENYYSIDVNLKLKPIKKLNVRGDWKLTYSTTQYHCETDPEACGRAYQHEWFTVIEDGQYTINHKTKLWGGEIIDQYEWIVTSTPINETSGYGLVKIKVNELLSYGFRYTDTEQNRFEIPAASNDPHSMGMVLERL